MPKLEFQGLYEVLFERLEKLDKEYPKDIIPFKTVFERICPNFSISKQQCWDLLFLLKGIGVVEIVPFHGIKFKGV